MRISFWLNITVVSRSVENDGMIEKMASRSKIGFFIFMFFYCFLLINRFMSLSS